MGNKTNININEKFTYSGFQELAEQAIWKPRI